MISINLFCCYEKMFNHMDTWVVGKNSIKHHYLRKKIYSHLNIENITAADYVHPQRVWKDFEIKYFVEYHDLYVQSNSLLLADVFESFWNMCLQIYELDTARFVIAPELA